MSTVWNRARRHCRIGLFAFLVVSLGPASRASAAEVLCDVAFQDCRTQLITLIRNEQVGIDVAFWFMEDARYTAELINRWQAGVPVRVIVDPRANPTYPQNADRLAELESAGIPMRRRTASGILHWKMMLFAGQNTVEFSGANYSGEAFVTQVPYQNYIDEVIYYSDDSSVTNSFRTKFDDLWTNTSQYGNYANVTTPTRRYATYVKDSELNFPPAESYRSRAVRRYDAETFGIDVTMYRITDAAHADAMIRAVQRGVPVRLITEWQQYRDPRRYWHAYNVDRMYVAGVQIRTRGHAGLMHQKSVLLRSQGMTIFGSSNWTSPSSSSQEEHNYFTTKPWFFQWFSDQFERKWNNSTGYAETQPFVPLPPDPPRYASPANGALNVSGSSVMLTWNGGLWAHRYDVYFGTGPEPPLVAADQPLGPSASASSNKTFAIANLQPNTTYYWRIVSKTMANLSASGPVFSFSTGDRPREPGQTDFDSDGIDDPTVFRPGSGAWFILASSTGEGTRVKWGVAGDTPVPADYDGDGKPDVAVYRTSTGVWYILRSSTGTAIGVQWGLSGDMPVPADFDGDGRCDPTVFRPSTGVWYELRSGSGGFGVAWGVAGDVPVPADYDGDGRADPAVFRPSTGTWYQLRSGTGTGYGLHWGAAGDVALAGDYDGDGKADPTVYRPASGVWYQFRSLTQSGFGVAWGTADDVPVVGDYDGDGKADPTVFRPSTGVWYQLRSRTGIGYGVVWGVLGDIPR